VWHTNVNIPNPIFSQNLSHSVGQLQPHLLSAAMDGNPIHVCVRPCEVEKFEKIRGVRLHLNDLRELRNPSFLQKDSLARQDVDDVLESKLCQGNRFRS
jgi:hypothetical protein